MLVPKDLKLLDCSSLEVTIAVERKKEIILAQNDLEIFAYHKK